MIDSYKFLALNKIVMITFLIKVTSLRNNL